MKGLIKVIVQFRAKNNIARAYHPSNILLKGTFIMHKNDCVAIL